MCAATRVNIEHVLKKAIAEADPRVMLVEERSPDSKTEYQGGKDMTTDESLAGSDKVRRFESVLHAKAQEEPEFRCYALSDKVWRMDILTEAGRRVRLLQNLKPMAWSDGLGNWRRN